MTVEKGFVDFIRSVLALHSSKAEEIASFFKPDNINKGEYFVRENSIANRYAFIISGFARAYILDREGDEITTGFYGSGQVICDLDSFFRRVPARENFLVIEDIECLSINFERVQEAFHGIPEFREWGRAMLIKSYAELKHRMISNLQQTAEERYLALIKHTPDIFKYAAFKDVASYLGITDTSLSRIRREIAKK